ncbi:MAG: DUF3320 domain-containing protein [Clostridia bacterium]|nr:DUF3320 domain-containing protein [Clostridia bacterium]
MLRIRCEKSIIISIKPNAYDAEEAELEAKSKKEFSESANHLPKGKGANTAGNKKGNNDMTTSGKTGKPVPKTGNGAGMRGVVQDETSKKKPVKVYRAVRFEQRNMTQKDFVEPGRHNLETAERILSVAEFEGPICEPLLTRRVLQSYSIMRAGPQVQQFMKNIYDGMKLDYITQDDCRVYALLSSQLHGYTEFRANGEGENKRDAKEIPHLEAANAICRALEEQFSLPEEELIRAAANLMNIGRVSTAVHDLFKAGIAWAENEKRIGKSANGNWMLQKNL